MPEGYHRKTLVEDPGYREQCRDSQIQADEQLRIFDSSTRSPAVKRQIPGSGLGLSIVVAPYQEVRT